MQKSFEEEEEDEDDTKISLPEKPLPSLFNPHANTQPSIPYPPPLSPSSKILEGENKEHESKTFSRSSNFISQAQLENGTSLRTLFIPAELRSRFLELALPNTIQNLEMCGVLSGRLIQNAFFVSCLIIPSQTCTSDSCTTENEEKIFEFQDGNDLLTLGWIHTHPTQSCFMSSVDLHTHCGYQVMLPEAVAIVLAPKQGEWGTFRLTDPPGKQTILNCRQPGLFHPHPESDTYTTALWREGHVKEVKGLKFSVVDLRDGEPKIV